MHPTVLAPRGRATGALKALDPEEVMGSSPIRGWDALYDKREYCGVLACVRMLRAFHKDEDLNASMNT